MNQTVLYPLQFKPIYQYRLWGGRRLAGLLSEPLPIGAPIGEAWILSDREDHASLVANGSLQGQTIGQVLQQFQDPLMGKLAQRFRRFPLLLKFLDAHEMLSVQVHPGYIPGSITGYRNGHIHGYTNPVLTSADGAKTEAWVVLEASNESRIYAGLKPDTTAEILRQSLTDGSLANQLMSITPQPGDGVFIPAGTVHSLGNGVVVFEIQQNSDVTFRLYDWGHVDAKTNQPRPLQVDQALASIDFVDGAAGLVTAVVETEMPVKRERLFHCEPFWLWRLCGSSPFTVGAEGFPRILVCIAGTGELEYRGANHVVGKGEVWLLPAAVGTCAFRPQGAVSLLEIAIPDDCAIGQDSA